MGIKFNKWKYKSIDVKKEKEYAEQLAITGHAARALNSKKPSNIHECRAILNPSMQQIESPFYIKNMRKAVDRIIKEKNSLKNILILTDKDSEGMISSIILSKTLELLKINHNFETKNCPHYNEFLQNITQKCTRENIQLIIAIGLSFLNEDLSSINTDIICIDTVNLNQSNDIIHLNINDNKKFPGMTNSGLVFKLGEALTFSTSPYYNKKIAVYDLETTGLDSQKDEIIEVASIIVENGISGESFHSLINPGKKISAKITSITGIKDEDVIMSPDSPTVIKDFLNFLSKADFISGHNILNFDNKFIFKEIRRSNLQQIKQKSLDTLLLSRKHLRDQNSFKLSSILDRFHYKEESYHRAMNDVKACAFALNKLLIMEITQMSLYYERVLPFAGISIIFNEAPIEKENRIILSSALYTIIKNSNKSLRPFFGILLENKNLPAFQIAVKHIMPIFAFSAYNNHEELREQLLLKNHIEFPLNKTKEESDKILNKYKDILTEKIKNTEKEKKFFLAQLPDIPSEFLRILARHCYSIINKPIILFSKYDHILKGLIFFGDNSVLKQEITKPIDKLENTLLFRNRLDFTASPESLEDFLSSLDNVLNNPVETKSEINFDTRINSNEKDITLSFEAFMKLGPFNGLSNKILFLLEDVMPNSIYFRNGLFSLKLHECKLRLFFKDSLEDMLKSFKNQRIDLLISFLGKNTAGSFCGLVEDIRKTPLF